MLALTLAAAPVSGAIRPPSGEQPSLPAGRARAEIVRDRDGGSPGLRARAPLRAPAAGETLYVFNADLETLTSPDNESGWTHVDLSAQPTAWHRDSFFGCQDSAWWCGLVDSTWIYDSNRAGYDNSWLQYLESSVDLSGIPLGQTVTMGFRHRLDAEPDYDFGYVEVLDIATTWVPLATFTGRVPNGQGCDAFTVVLPDTIRQKHNPVFFRFVFESDIG